MRQCLLRNTLLMLRFCVVSDHLRTEVWVYIHTEHTMKLIRTTDKFVWHTMSWYKMAATFQFKNHRCSWSKLSLNQFSKINQINVPQLWIKWKCLVYTLERKYIYYALKLASLEVQSSIFFVWIQFITYQLTYFDACMNIIKSSCPHGPIDL